MGFIKAEPQQGFLKVSLYGPPGSGKSFSTLLFAEGLVADTGKKIAYVDTERGTDFYAKEAPRTVHPEPFNFDALYTTSLMEVLESVKKLDPNEYGVIVIDSISHMWDAAMAAYEGKKTKVDSIPMHAWGAIKKPYKELVRWLMDSPFHVFILGRQKNLFETDDKDQLKKVGVGLRAEGETAYEPHICGRFEARQDEKNSTVSTYFLMFEKDRTGVLAGRTYSNPSFKTLSPVMPLLNGKQAQSEDPDDVAMKDAELHEKDKEKKAKKDEKSRELFTDFNARIVGAKDLESLNAIATDLKKQKRYIMEDNLSSLRITFEERKDRITNEKAGEI